MKRVKLFLTIVLVISLVSCASIKIDYGNGVTFELINGKALYPLIDEYQLIYGSFPYLGDDMAFESLTHIENGCIDIVAFLPTGQTFAKIGWDGKHLSYESSIMPKGKYFAQYIISDLQLCYASYDAIRDNFSETGYSISEVCLGSTTTRTVKCRGEVVERIVITPGYITVENVEANYKYEIETL